MEEVVTAVVLELRLDEFALGTTLLERTEAFLVGALHRHDLFRCEALGTDFSVANRVTVEAQVQQRIEAVEVLGPFAAEARDCVELVHVRAHSHGLETHLQATFQQEGQGRE